MYCLDTSVIVAIFRGDEDLKLKLEKIQSLMLDVFITPISLCELYKGAYTVFESDEEVKNVDRFVSSFGILDFNEEACRKFGEEYAKLRRAGKMTQELDLMIASIAKVNDLVVITRNKKHFENIDVEIEVLCVRC